MRVRVKGTAAAVAAAAALALAQGQGIKRTILQRLDVTGSESKECVFAMAEISPGATVGKHIHRGFEVALARTSREASWCSRSNDRARSRAPKWWRSSEARASSSQ